MLHSSGVDLLNSINDGILQKAPSEYVLKHKIEVSEALMELIEVGARIRPLLLDGKRIGWVRGLPPSEKKQLLRWITDKTSQIELFLKYSTTLSIQDIRNLSKIEVLRLLRLVNRMGDSDASLFPFIGAFVTTSSSELLWYSSGNKLSSFTDKIVTLPDGLVISVPVPSDHARLWALLCTTRVDAKARLDSAMNAVLTIRPWVGKGADPLSAELKSVALSLKTDTLSPWSEIITYQDRSKTFNDGWAHSEDDSVEGLLRELDGAMGDDRHEKLMEEFFRQQELRNRTNDVISQVISNEEESEDLVETKLIPITKQEFKAREAALSTPKIKPVVSTNITEEEMQLSAIERLAKYR